MPIRGILFDKDGTLLDFAATWVPVNRIAALTVAGGDAALAARLLAAGGQDPVTGEVRAGAPLAAGHAGEIAALWAGILGEGDVVALTRTVDRVFVEEGARHAVAVTDLPHLLAGLRARGLKLGIATSDSAAGLAASMELFGIAALLDYAAGFDSGHGAKPDPGMVHGFCRAAGLAPHEVAVVGDNLHDLEMGRRAGAGLLVGVLTGTGTRDGLAPAADHVIDDVGGLAALIESLEGRLSPGAGG
jgi:phosphoglycolate phosphatase